jgi:hypothetical protein
MISIGQETQTQVRGADGSILWQGTAVVGVGYVMKNNDAAAMAMSEGVRWDVTNDTAARGVIPRLETTAAGATATADLPQSLALYMLRIAGATDVGFVGVVLEPVAVGGQGLVAGIGSLVSVKTTATALAIGTTVGGSATAGLAAANTTATQILGTVFKINTVAQPGTGSTGFAGILVNPR